VFKSISKLFKRNVDRFSLKEIELRLRELEIKINLIADQLNSHSLDIAYLSSEIEEIKKKLALYKQDLDELYWRTRRL